MKIRWRLNLAVFVLIGVFLLAAALSLWAVNRNAAQTRANVELRQQARLTADILTGVYAVMAATADEGRVPAHVTKDGWAPEALNDINVQIRLSQADAERKLWEDLRASVIRLDETLKQHQASTAAPKGEAPTKDAAPARTEADIRERITETERILVSLRGFYDGQQADSDAEAAWTSLWAQWSIAIACGITVLLFVIYLLMVRAWLIRPIDTLKASADAIGEGDLHHEVPLRGNDELAELARRLERMAQRLDEHQQALVQTRELSAIGEMCANVAHGLRNPLAAIRTSAQLAARRAENGQTQTTGFEELAAQADLMDARITRLFHFSRPLTLRSLPTTFAELSQAVRAQAKPVLQTTGVGLDIEDHTGDTVWHLDREAIAEALAELVNNAAYHSQPGASVQFVANVVEHSEKQQSRRNGAQHRELPFRKLAGGGQQLQVSIIDHGAGMSEATLGKAFDLFFTARTGGTGMGLAFVRRTVEKHGGTIRAESKLRQGTSMHLILPNA